MNNVKARRGFVLAAVLWLLAGLTVVAALASRYAVSAGENAQLLRYRAEAERDFLSTRSQVLNLLATTVTQPEGRMGASTALRLDDFVYVGVGETTVSLQDARGLIDLSRASEALLMRLLEGCGVPEGDRGHLAAALLDYTDADDLTRLNGAEVAEYRERGLPPPRNAPLVEVAELWQVLGWGALQDSWEKNGCMDALTVASDGGFNINTAPHAALVAQGMGAAFADTMIAKRQDGTAAAFASAVSNFDENPNPILRNTNTYAGRIYRVSHTHVPSGYTLQYWVTLNTTRPDVPWLLQSETFSVAGPDQAPTKHPLLPVFVNSVTTSTSNEPAKPNSFPFTRQ